LDSFCKHYRLQNAEGNALNGKLGVGENGLRFLQKLVQMFVLAAEVANEKAFYTRNFGNGGRLTCRAVEAGFGAFFQII
jgi:hypothetical protein